MNRNVFSKEQSFIPSKSTLSTGFLKFTALSLFLLTMLAAFLSFSNFPNKMYKFSAHATSEGIEAKGMVVIESSTGRVLLSQDKDQRLPMASTTKIITAILALENSADIDTLVKVPDAAVGVEGSSMFLRKGEQFSIRNLLFGLMLPSGNDAANALAIIVFGSIENFQKQANEFVQKLGLSNTHIVTPSGLHAVDHFTSAHDLAIIAAYAMKNETFRQIVATRHRSIPKSEVNEQREMRNKNKIMYNYNLINGVKTGFTPEAGRCLVASANNGNLELICVLLNCPRMEEIGQELLESCFSSYKMYEVVKPYMHISSLPVSSSKTREVNIGSKNPFSYPMTEVEANQIKLTFEHENQLTAPVAENQIVGKLKVSLGNHLLFEDDIYTINAAENDDFEYLLKNILKKFR